jgi:hypothetical protein
MNLFYLSSSVVFFAALMEGKKTGLLGAVLGLVVGLAMASVFYWSAVGLVTFLPERLNISKEPNAPKGHIVFGYFLTLVLLLWLITMSFGAFWITKHAVQLIDNH